MTTQTQPPRQPPQPAAPSSPTAPPTASTGPLARPPYRPSGHIGGIVAGSMATGLVAAPQPGHRLPLTRVLLHDRDPDSYRREVAILFADISGFTRLTETVDPEIVYQTVSPLLDDLVIYVHQHGGQVQQVLGDGFMAAFGLHSTRGDEAEQAVRAGRAMLASGVIRPAPLDVHIGIECGEVLVTHPRDPGSFGIWGHAVNVARRLCDTAAAGQLVVGEAAFTRCRHQVGSPATALLQLHGIARPVLACRIIPSQEHLAPASRNGQGQVSRQLSRRAEAA